MEASRKKPEQAQTKTSRFQHMQCAQIFVVSKYGRLSAMFFKIGELSASTRRGTSAEGFGLVSLVRPGSVGYAHFFSDVFFGLLLLVLFVIHITGTIGFTITITITITITSTSIDIAIAIFNDIDIDIATDIASTTVTTTIPMSITRH